MSSEYLKLKETHPITKALSEVFDLLNKHKLQFKVVDNGGIVVYSQDYEYEFELKDTDSLDQGVVNSLPPTFEYIIRYKREGL